MHQHETLIVMQMGLGPDHIVSDGHPAPPPQKEGEGPKFRPMSVVANYFLIPGCMD